MFDRITAISCSNFRSTVVSLLSRGGWPYTLVRNLVMAYYFCRPSLVIVAILHLQMTVLENQILVWDLLRYSFFGLKVENV